MHKVGHFVFSVFSGAVAFWYSAALEVPYYSVDNRELNKSRGLRANHYILGIFFLIYQYLMRAI